MRNAKTRRLRNDTKEKRKTEKGVTVREVKFGYASLPRKKLEIKEISGIKEILDKRDIWYKRDKSKTY